MTPAQREARRRLGVGADVPATAETLADLRAEIGDIDHDIARLLAARFRLTGQVGLVKILLGAEASDPARERLVLAHVRRVAGDEGERVGCVYLEVMKTATAQQSAAMKECGA